MQPCIYTKRRERQSCPKHFAHKQLYSRPINDVMYIFFSQKTTISLLTSAWKGGQHRVACGGTWTLNFRNILRVHWWTRMVHALQDVKHTVHSSFFQIKKNLKRWLYDWTYLLNQTGDAVDCWRFEVIFNRCWDRRTRNLHGHYAPFYNGHDVFCSSFDFFFDSPKTDLRSQIVTPVVVCCHRMDKSAWVIDPHSDVKYRAIAHNVSLFSYD